MCGIAGLISSTPLPLGRARSIVRAMNEAERHRGPDGEGVVLLGDGDAAFARWDASGVLVEERGGADPEAPVRAALGQRRLAIRDVEGGVQPMADRDGRVWITFNGEIYNCDELSAALGARFRTHSDTEVILESYLAWGERCVERLDGMFAFAIWDGRAGTLLLARDRLGIKPLVVAHTQGALLFASEVKSLLASGLVERAVRPEAVYRYLHHLYVPAPDGPFRDVEIVRPGYALVVRPGGAILRRRYWQIDFEAAPPRTPAHWRDALRGKLTRAVRSHLVSDVPLGAFLSGGLDSSIIVALMASAIRGNGARVLTNTVAFDQPEHDESSDARIMADHVGADHQEVPVTFDEVDGSILDVLGQYDQPFADSSAVPTYLLCRSTARRVKVALAGDGADELLAGYPRLRQYAVLEAMRHAPRAARAAGAVAAIASHALVGLAARRARNLAAYTQALGPKTRDAMDAYVHLRNVFRDGWLERLVTEDFRRAVQGDDPAFHIREVARESRAPDPLSKLLHVELMTYLPNDILQKVDIASMAFGLEVRVPFLDHHVVELVARMPIWAKLTPFRQKAVLRDAFGPMLPLHTLRKRKQGFHLPVSAWFRGRGAAIARDVLLSPRAGGRGLFVPRTVETMVVEHTTGAADHGARLWTLLALELWHRRYVDGGP